MELGALRPEPRPVPEVLSLELNEHGVTMRSLDDGGEGFGGEIVRAVRSVISGQDMRDRVRKSAMGKLAKARKVIEIQGNVSALLEQMLGTEGDHGSTER